MKVKKKISIKKMETNFKIIILNFRKMMKNKKEILYKFLKKNKIP